MRAVWLLPALVLLMTDCSNHTAVPRDTGDQGWYGLAIDGQEPSAGATIAVRNMPRFPWQYGYGVRTRASGPIDRIELGTIGASPPQIHDPPLPQAYEDAIRRERFRAHGAYRHGVPPPALHSRDISPADMLHYAAASLRDVERRLGAPTAVRMESDGFSPFGSPLHTYQAYWAGRNRWNDEVVRAGFYADVDCIMFTIRSVRDDVALLQSSPFDSQVLRGCRAPDSIPS